MTGPPTAIDVQLLTGPFDPAAGLRTFTGRQPASGAIASFLGQVRADGTEVLELTHYAPLTLPGVERLAREAAERWAIDAVLVHHRVGQLGPGEPIVLVAVAAPHRRAALTAVDFIMDRLKSTAWFWKRERRAGYWRWIEPRGQDRDDLARWD